MKAIVGRLSDLGLRELLRLLTSVRAEGTLEVDGPLGRAHIDVRDGHASGPLSTALAAAYQGRCGRYSFLPRPIVESAPGLPVEEVLSRLEAAARTLADQTPAGADGDGLLADLRGSLEALVAPAEGVRIAVLALDPRPYRNLSIQWRERGWEVELVQEPRFPSELAPHLLVLHLPTSGTLAGQGEVWVGAARRAATAGVPTVWIGGLADPRLRHDAIAAGAAFLLPAPAAEVGQAANWFREDLTTVIERVLTSRPAAAAEAEVLRDVFQALQMDAAPADMCASLLRFAATFFARGALLAVRDTGFESLGCFGFPQPVPRRLSRGEGALEEAVLLRGARSLTVQEQHPLGRALGVGDLEQASTVPVFRGLECVAVLIGDRPLPTGADLTALVGLLARSGPMLGL